MNFFRNVKLTTKLFMVLALVLVGFSVIGVMDANLFRVQDKLTADTKQLNAFVTATNNTQNAFVASTTALANAVLAKELNPESGEFESEVNRFKSLINNANVGTAELEKLAQNDRQEEVIYQLRDEISAYQRTALSLTDLLTEGGATGTINAALDNVKQQQAFVDPLISSMVKITTQAITQNERNAEQTLSVFNATFLAVVTGVAVLVLLSFLLLAAGVRRSLSTLSSTIEKISAGQFDARVNLGSTDELGLLGDTLDSLLEDRFKTRETAELENEKLNDSIVELLDGVADLSERNLTVRLPVNEDVTGPLSDAINMLSSETAKVLLEILSVSGQVEDVSGRVQAQGNRVNELAANERMIVENTITRLNEASVSMAEVAQLAKDCNDTAAKASASTQDAMRTVDQSATGMGVIRETIAETEKRVKRLGERSQEIASVVEIINNIAERTQVLALNASMQAAAAGDAGRGFAVVADEVQRLAVSSRQSTSEIATLVDNIQSETAETMATMNKTIAQVVDGTELTQAAGGQMQATQKTTSELASAVEKILDRSIAQAKVNESLLEQAAKVQKSTEETSNELDLQANETSNLVKLSKRMVESVNVFQLPTTS